MKPIINLLTGWMMLFLFQPLLAQNLMVINQGNGTKIQLPLESIDSIRLATLPPPVIQKLFQNNGNVLALAVNDIDSITYDLPNPQSLPQVNTQSATAIGTSTVSAQAEVLNDGGSPITQRGFCWSLQPMPSLGNNITLNGSGTGSFGSSITPLQAGTLYFVRAYATNSSGTAYGGQISVNTQAPSGAGNLATVSTAPVQNSLGLSAICGGDVTADGGLAVTARGVCWAAGTTPSLNHSFTMDGAGAGTFSSNLGNLLPNTTYFVRAYATNDAGTAYGASYEFTTMGLPVVRTDSVNLLPNFSARANSKVENDGGGLVFSKGVCWSTGINPTISLSTKTNDGIGSGVFTSMLSGLNPSTLYYLRAYATNAAGTAYGNLYSFQTTEPIAINLDSVKYLLTGGSRKTWRLDSLNSTPVTVGLEMDPFLYYAGGPLAFCQKDDWYTFTQSDSIYVNTNGSALQPSQGYTCGFEESYSAPYSFGNVAGPVAGLAQINLEPNNPNQWIGVLDRPDENVYRILEITPTTMILRCGNGSGIIFTLKFILK
jgi:hypothetical protein